MYYNLSMLKDLLWPWGRIWQLSLELQHTRAAVRMLQRDFDEIHRKLDEIRKVVG